MEKECTLTGEEFAGNLQGDDYEGLNALKGRVRECSECLSKNEKEMPFENLMYPGEAGQTYSRLGKRRLSQPLI